MTPEAQVLFFQRVRERFDKCTTGVPINQKKRYRLAAEDLQKTRNVCVLFQQCWQFLRTNVGPEVEHWQTAFLRGADEDWKLLLDTRPSKIAVSMLQSVQDKARQTLLQKEAVAMQDVEDQRQQVLQAEWSLFCSGLKKDHETLKQAADAPRRVKALQHARDVEHRQKQAADGLKAAKGYQARY